MRKTRNTTQHEPPETEWRWSPEQQGWYREYLDNDGNRQYEWSLDDTPRVSGTPDLSNLNINDEVCETPPNNYEVAPGHGQGASQHYSQSSHGQDASQHHPQSQGASYHPSQLSHGQGASHHHSQSKGKGKGRDKGHDQKTSKSKKDTSKGTEKKGKGKGNEGPPVVPEQGHVQGRDYQAPKDPKDSKDPKGPKDAKGPKDPKGPKGPKPGIYGGGAQEDAHPIDPGYGCDNTESTGPSEHGQDYTGQPYSHAQYGGFVGDGTYADPQHQVGTPSPFEGYSESMPSTDAAGDDDEGDAEMQRLINESKEAAFAGGAGYQYGAGYEQGEPSYNPAEDYGAIVDNEEGDGERTPTADNPMAAMTDMVIKGTHGNFESIDSRYKVERSERFQPGEVFKILWSEPQGHNSSGHSSQPDRVSFENYTEKYQMENDWGEPFYVGFRRFIVVANDEGHCTCVPILTYIRQGCKKKGVKPAKHGIIHENGTKARLLDGEPKLGFSPVRMSILATGERLAKESRVNYSKLVTVEHNVKVFFIGHIVPEDFDNVIPGAIDRCWQEKSHKRVRKGLANVRQ